jgi:hypothetical protein
MSHGARQAVEDRGGRMQGFLVMRAEDRDLPRQGADAATTRLEEQALAFHSRGEVDGAPITRAGVLCDECFCFEGVDDAGHGRRADLLRIGEAAEGDGTGKDDDGKSRETGGIEAGGRIGLAQPAQQMNGSRVKRLGGGLGIDAFSS